MGWLSFGRASGSEADEQISANAAPTVSTTSITETASENLSKSTSKAKVAAAVSKQEKVELSEAEQLDLLIGGARLDDTAAKEKASFLASNTRHMYLDGFLSCAVYTFSGLQHIQGQSNALTLLTMWTVGTTFLVDAGERKYLQEALQGTLPTLMNAAAAGAEGKPGEAVEKADGAVPVAKANGASPATLSSAAPAAPLDAEKLAEQQRKIFMTPTVASWVWMLASFQQFKVHKRLKWCGYSSWMGLGCVSYYTTRHMYNLLVA